jgi:hypothetical protein
MSNDVVSILPTITTWVVPRPLCFVIDSGVWNPPVVIISIMLILNSRNVTTVLMIYCRMQMAQMAQVADWVRQLPSELPGLWRQCPCLKCVRPALAPVVASL